MEDLKKKLNTLEEERSAVNKEIDESKAEAIELIKEALKEGKKKEELLDMGFLKEYIEEAEGTENIPSGSFQAPKEEKTEPSLEDKKLFFEMIEKINNNSIKINKLKEELLSLQQEKSEAEKNNTDNIKTVESEKEITGVPKNEPANETKKENKEELNSGKLKTEIEKVIKSFTNTLREEGLIYKGLDIETKGDSFYMVAHLAGTGLQSIAIGKPKFVVDIKSRDGKIVVAHNELRANPVVKTFVKQEVIDKFANTIGDEIRKYIEKDRKKEVERIDIENGVLKITYK